MQEMDIHQRMADAGRKIAEKEAGEAVRPNFSGRIGEVSDSLVYTALTVTAALALAVSHWEFCKEATSIFQKNVPEESQK